MRSFSRDRSVTAKKLPKGTARRIATLANPYRRLVVLLLGLLAVDAIAGAATPLLVRAILNDGIPHKNASLVVVLALILAGLAVIEAALSLVERYASSRIGEGLIYDMRAKVFAHVQRMPIAFFTRTHTGALISRLNNDVLGAQRVFTSTLTSLVSSIFTLSLTLGVMFTLSWQITLVAIAMLPLFLLPARWIGRKLATITRESYNLNASMNTTMTERFNVAGALLVKIFGRPAEEDAQFSGEAARVRDIGVTSAMYGRVFFAALMLVASLATALVYGWGGVEAVHGVLDVGTVVALALYLTQLYGPLTSLSNVNVDVMTALVSFDRVFEVLDLKSIIVERPEAIELPAGPAAIEFDHVDFAYPSAAAVSLASLESVDVLDDAPQPQVLHDVSFTAAPGELVALVGPSGAGKTTISQLVSRLYDADRGAVRLAGVDVRDTTFESIRDTVGYVTQDAHMFHDTIRANLLYAKPLATDAELWAAIEQAQIVDLVRSLPDQLDTVVGERGYRLSGGEKQRLAIARLLLKAPRVVVLDEATAHLDSESEAAVQLAFSTALAGRTALVIAHRLSTVREAHMIVVLDGGRVVEKGTHDELIVADGLYSELYHTQFDRAPH
ncbi:MAG: ABC transporter ATP-binding protein [Nakamurella sp.]